MILSGKEFDLKKCTIGTILPVEKCYRVLNKYIKLME